MFKLTCYIPTLHSSDMMINSFIVTGRDLNCRSKGCGEKDIILPCDHEDKWVM